MAKLTKSLRLSAIMGKHGAKATDAQAVPVQHADDKTTPLAPLAPSKVDEKDQTTADNKSVKSMESTSSVSSADSIAKTKAADSQQEKKPHQKPRERPLYIDIGIYVLLFFVAIGSA